MANDQALDSNIAVRPDSKLRQIFPGGEIYAVTDDDWLGEKAGQYGLSWLSLSDAEKLPDGANVVLFLRHGQVSADLRRRFRTARVLVVPIASFDPSPEAALYTQRLTMLTDYAAACERGRYWVSNIKRHTGRLVFSSAEGAGNDLARTNLTCELARSLSADAWLEPVLKQGQWIGVGSYCELSMTVRPSSGRPRPFLLRGTAVASGVLVARDPRCDEAGDRRIRFAADLRAELAAHAPVVLELEHSVLRSARAGGQDFTAAIREATNPEHGLHALELGIGTNQSVLPHVTWGINSQLNEGAGPVHIGFGEGMTGAHMDFIIAEADHKFT